MSNKHILVANSETSFLDLCTNNLVSGCDVYCTFEVCDEDMGWMKHNLKNLGHIVAYFAAKRIGKEHLIKKPYTV